jgi:hypothetical protein
VISDAVPVVSWPQVAYALIIGLPAIIGAVAAIFAARSSAANKHALVTGNDKTVGEMVTEVHGVAATNGVTYEQHGTPPATEGAG